MRQFIEPSILIAIVLVSLLLIMFVLFPLVQVFKSSFIVKDEESGKPTATFKYFVELLSKSYNRQPIYNSVILGLCVSIIGTFIGFVFAYAIVKTQLPFKGFFKAIATLPMISPPFVISLSAILLLGRNGLISRKILLDIFGIDLYMAGFDIYGLTGLIIVETLAYFPTAFLLLIGILESIDPSIEDAAHSLGASRLKSLLSVTLPLALPGIAASMLLIFIESLADFGNPLILSGRFNVASVQAYLQITGNDNLPGGSALALVLLIPSLAAYSLQNYLLEKGVRKKSFVTLGGKSRKISRTQAGGFGVEKRLKYSVLAISVAVIAFILLFYGLVLVGSFTKLWGLNYSLTRENYVEAFKVSWDYIRDSLLLAAIATPFTGLLGMIVAYLLKRKRFIGRKFMDITSMLTFAAPGTVVGIGYLLTFNKTPLQGSAAIIVLLFIFRNMPVGIRAAAAAFDQIDTSIDDASTDLGARGFTTFRRVLLPMITPAFFAGLAHSFVRCMTAISAVIFIVSGKWNLITVAILGFVENSDFSQAAALSIILILFVMAALGITQILLKIAISNQQSAIS